MVSAASRYPLIREFSTTANYVVSLNGRQRQFNNTNALGASLGGTSGSQSAAQLPTNPLVNTQYQGAGFGQLPGNLLPQTSNWNNFYGPMSVPDMHFARLNRRFGWDPTGIGYGTYWNPQQPAYYSPTAQYPTGAFPSLMR